MEKIVNKQLRTFLSEFDFLDSSQHGFTAGRSTLTNLLSTDANISNILSKKHSFDIISFDFLKAFEKAPHHHVVAAIAELGIKGRSLDWFTSFLAGRTFQVRVGEHLSSVNVVSSGVIQGSVLGPALYAIFINSLLRKVRLPIKAFADDFKFVADVNEYDEAYIQSEVDVVEDWSEKHHAPLSVDKCTVMHCGRQQRRNVYYINGTPIGNVESLKDLGVTPVKDGNNAGH